jgi:hypothetical protein
MSLLNYFYNDSKKKVHHPSLPYSFRMLIVGQSGCGKTTLLMRLLLQEDMLNYDNLYVFSKSLYQPEYECLKQGFEKGLPKSAILGILNMGDEIEKCGQTIEDVVKSYAIFYDCDSEINAEFYNSANDVPDPTELDIKKRNLMVFDDIMTERSQKTPENYYTRGRTCNCDSIYLSQNYIKLPLHTIRSNSNLMIFFKLSPMDKTQLFIKFASVDMNKKEFDRICEQAWKDDYGYLVIDTTQKYSSGNKYRFDIII